MKVSGKQAAFNSTLEELKWGYANVQHVEVTTFNSTLEELKYALGTSTRNRKTSFNSTLEELKLRPDLSVEFPIKLLIAP